MKQCDLCHKHEAVMKVRMLDKDGKSTEIEVCAECASRRGFSEAEQVKLNIAQVLAEMKSGKTAAEDQKLVCGRCGLTFAQFKRSGRLGCADCYESFRAKLEPLVRRLHNSVQHVGKTASCGRSAARARFNAQRLNSELAQAIEQEDYERAALLRDQLKRAAKDVQR